MLAVLLNKQDSKTIQQCPYCLSGNLKVKNYRACKGRERKYGTTLFIKTCQDCKEDAFYITSSETLEKRRLRYKAEVASGKVVE